MRLGRAGPAPTLHPLLTFPNICLKVSSLVNSPVDLGTCFLPIGDGVASSDPGTGMLLILAQLRN